MSLPRATDRVARAPADARPTSSSPEYCPFPITSDPRRFGLTTSSMHLATGPVVVRHGRRTSSDTATILLHGAAGSWTTWTPLLAAADVPAVALTDLVIPDLPGWGDSPLAPSEASRSVEALADTVAEIARALGYSRWNVVGHSLGGFVALELASVEVRATTSVGLVSAATFSVIDSVRHPLTRFTLLPGYTALLQFMRLLSLSGPVGRGFLVAIERMRLLRAFTAPLFSRPAHVPASVIAAFGSEVRPRSFAVASARAGAYDPETSWARIVCPVRACRGDSDVFVAATDDDRLRGVLCDFEVTTLHETGHFGHVEWPFDTLRLLFALRSE